MKWGGSPKCINMSMYSSNWVLPCLCVGPSRIILGFHFTGVSLDCLAAQLEEEGSWRSTPSSDLCPPVGRWRWTPTAHVQERKREVPIEKQTTLGHVQGEQRGQLQHLKKWGVPESLAQALCHMFSGLSRLMVRFLAMFWLTPTYSCIDFSRKNNS